MQIYVKMLTGQTITLNVDPKQTTVKALKRLIQNQESSIKESRQTILYNNEQLDDSSRTLESYGITEEGSSLHLVVKAKKGGCALF